MTKGGNVVRLTVWRSGGGSVRYGEKYKGGGGVVMYLHFLRESLAFAAGEFLERRGFCVKVDVSRVYEDIGSALERVDEYERSYKFQLEFDF